MVFTLVAPWRRRLGWQRQCKGWWTRRYRQIAADTDRSETSNRGEPTHSVGEIKSQVAGNKMRKKKKHEKH